MNEFNDDDLCVLRDCVMDQLTTNIVVLGVEDTGLEADKEADQKFISRLRSHNRELLEILSKLDNKLLGE